jgi:predicted nucleotidyltransferase
MRKSAIVDSLFPRIRKGVLAATLTQPDKWWYLTELAKFLHTSPSSLQRELSSLAASGILQGRREGARVYFKANPGSPIFPDLRNIVEKTVGLLPTVAEALRTLDSGIRCAFVYGSVARGEEHGGSDVDLMVIGSAGLADLSPGLRKAERLLGREVNATCYSPSEFRDKVTAKDHFLATVLRGPKQFLKGGQGDLDQIAR